MLAEFLIRDGALDCLGVRVHLVALPAGIFWTELRVRKLLVRHCAALVKGGWLRQAIDVQVSCADVGEEVILFAGRGFG